jgi:hypothetical protein
VANQMSTDKQIYKVRAVAGGGIDVESITPSSSVGSSKILANVR